MQKRGYANLSHGQIHYRRAGHGPVVILLHQSPCSSRDYKHLLDTWSEHFTVIAPDNPGNGMSDPLTTPNPTMIDYAAALIEFMDSLDIKNTLLYGYHTGASIAAAAAAKHPERISLAVANGVSLLHGAQQKDFIKNYMPPFNADESGEHLTWLWHRVKSQAEVFPWYSTKPEGALDIPPYSVEKCQIMLEDFLSAGNDYIAPYRAAFAFDPIADGLLPAHNLIICSSDKDPLKFCMERLPAEQRQFIAETMADCEQKALSIFKK